MFAFSEITVHVRGGRWRPCDCAGCGTQFNYFVEKTVARTRYAPYMIGQKRAEKLAREAAEDALADQLETAQLPVPCPQCGIYQTDMVPLVTSERFRVMRHNTVAFLCVSPLIFFICMTALVFPFGDKFFKLPSELVIFLTLVCMLVAISPALFMWRRRCRSEGRFDPNTDIPLDERLTLGRELAVWEKPPKP